VFRVQVLGCSVEGSGVVANDHEMKAIIYLGALISSDEGRDVLYVRQRRENLHSTHDGGPTLQASREGSE